MTEVPTTENMRWLLANAGPEIGWPEQAFKALVDITKVCEIIESQGLLRTADDGWQPIETAPKDEVFVCRNKNKPHVTFEAVLFWDSESWEMPEKYLCLHNMTIDEPIDQDWSKLEWRPLPKAEVKND